MFIWRLGQFTRNYTQTTKRGLLTTNGGMLPERAAYRLFCCLGFPKGLAPWHTTLLAKCSVLYALSALLRKCGCRWGEQGHLKQQENRAVIAWRGAASAGLVSSADRAYMKAPSLVLRRTSGQNVPNLWTHSRKSRQIFLSKLKWAGSHFRAFPP